MLVAVSPGSMFARRLPPRLGGNTTAPSRKETCRDALRKASRRDFALELAAQKAAADRLAVGLAPAAVGILQMPSWAGSVTAIRRADLALTAGHVVKGMKPGQSCKTIFGRQSIRAALLAVDDADDLALLDLASEAPYSLPIAAADHNASACCAIGFPGARPPVAVAKVELCGEFGGKVWANVELHNGMSGGALIDATTGDLCGIISGVFASKGIEEFTGLAAIRRLLDDHA